MTSAACSCSTTTWPVPRPTTSRRASASSTRTASTRNWPSPTPCWRCSTTRTRRCASGSSGSTTSTSPSCRSARNGHFYGVGLINWWDPKGTRSTLAELKSLGLKTFLLPLNPGKDDDGNIYDYGSTAMDAVWDEIEDAGLPVTHHIGETPPKTPCENNSVVVGMMVNVDSFREQFAKYVFSGILDRHPKLQDRLVRGRDRLGANRSAGRRAHAGLLPAHVQPRTPARRPALLGQPHERVVHGGPAGTAADRPDRRRQRDVVQRLPAQREHLRLLGEVAGHRRRGGRPGGRGQDRQHQHQEVPGLS